MGAITAGYCLSEVALVSRLILRILALHVGIQPWILRALSSFRSLGQGHVDFEDLLILHWHLRSKRARSLVVDRVRRLDHLLIGCIGILRILLQILLIDHLLLAQIV